MPANKTFEHIIVRYKGGGLYSCKRGTYHKYLDDKGPSRYHAKLQLKSLDHTAVFYGAVVYLTPVDEYSPFKTGHEAGLANDFWLANGYYSVYDNHSSRIEPSLKIAKNPDQFNKMYEGELNRRRNFLPFYREKAVPRQRADGEWFITTVDTTSQGSETLSFEPAPRPAYAWDEDEDEYEKVVNPFSPKKASNKVGMTTFSPKSAERLGILTAFEYDQVAPGLYDELLKLNSAPNSISTNFNPFISITMEKENEILLDLTTTYWKLSDTRQVRVLEMADEHIKNVILVLSNRQTAIEHLKESNPKAYEMVKDAKTDGRTAAEWINLFVLVLEQRKLKQKVEKAREIVAELNKLKTVEERRQDLQKSLKDLGFEDVNAARQLVEKNEEF
jgi:hypothetical protein